MAKNKRPSTGHTVPRPVKIPAGANLLANRAIAESALSNTVGSIYKSGLVDEWTLPCCLIATDSRGDCIDVGCHRQTKFTGTYKAGTRRKFYLYHVAYVASSDEAADLLAAAGSDQQVSHCCGNSGCINPAHLVLGPEAVNKERNVCHAVGLQPRDGKTFSICRHDPPRISRRSLELICWLSVKCGLIGVERTGGTAL